MDDKDTIEMLPFLSEVERDKREELENYFKTAPLWLLDMIRIENVPKDTILVREGEPADAVFLIGKGVIKATDFRICGIHFDFTMFSKTYAFGAMEIIMHLDLYQTTLSTFTDCTVLTIPRKAFKQWLDSDIVAFKREGCLMGEYLLEQARESRIFLFLQGTNRVMYLLLRMYQKYARAGILEVTLNQQEISDFTGLCVKTISRSLKKLKGDGLITLEDNRFFINQVQRDQMDEIISQFLDEKA